MSRAAMAVAGALVGRCTVNVAPLFLPSLDAVNSPRCISTNDLSRNDTPSV
jgi:hypothetical protein